MPPQQRQPVTTLPPVLEVDLSEYTASANVMVYGVPGCGKTAFASHTPNASIWSPEPGIVTAKRLGFKGGFVRLDSIAHAREAVKEAERGKFDHRDWLVLDTTTTLQTMGLHAAVDRDVQGNPRQDPDVPAVQHYLKAQNGIKRLVERMVDLPVNCLFLSHAMLVTNDNGDQLWLPDAQGGADKGFPVANYLMALMNVVGFMQVTTDQKGNQVRRTLWQSYYDEDNGIRYTAKDQYDVLGMYSDNKNMDWVASRITGALGQPAKQAKKGKAARG